MGHDVEYATKHSDSATSTDPLVLTLLEVKRRARGLTQAALAKLAGVQAADICRVERGYGPVVSKRTTERLATFLGLSTEQLSQEVSLTAILRSHHGYQLRAASSERATNAA